MTTHTIINGDVCRRRPCARRGVNRLKPVCEPLDDRQLLSTVAALPMPSASVAANAAAALEAADPEGIREVPERPGRGREPLARHPGPGQRSSPRTRQPSTRRPYRAGLSPSVAANELGMFRSFLDNAFQALPAHVATERLYLFVYPSNGQPRPFNPNHDPSIVKNIQPMLDRSVAQVPDGKQLAQDTIDQMRAIAQAIGLTPRLHAALSNDAKTLSNQAGPGNFAIYFDSQVMNFVH